MIPHRAQPFRCQRSDIILHGTLHELGMEFHPHAPVAALETFRHVQLRTADFRQFFQSVAPQPLHRLAPAADDLRQLLQLDPRNGRVDLIHIAVQRGEEIGGSGRSSDGLAAVRTALDFQTQFLRTGEDRSALTACAEMFPEHQRKTAEVSEGPDIPPVDPGHMRLRTVFHHRKMMFFRHAQDSGHVRRISENMRDQNGRGAFRDPGLDLFRARHETSRRRIRRYRNAVVQDHRHGSARIGDAPRDHFGKRRQMQGPQGHKYRIGSRIRAVRVSASQKFGKFRAEGFLFRSVVARHSAHGAVTVEQVGHCRFFFFAKMKTVRQFHDRTRPAVHGQIIDIHKMLFLSLLFVIVVYLF